MEEAVTSETSFIFHQTTRGNSFLLNTSVAVEGLALLLRIQVVLGLDLDPKSDYCEWGFSWLSSAPTPSEKAGTVR
jgi:hypothetical protein